MDDDPVQQTRQQEKKEFSTLLTLGIIYAVGSVGVVLSLIHI